MPRVLFCRHGVGSRWIGIMKQLVRVVVVTALLLASAACSSTLAPSTDLTGTWIEPFSIPGASFSVALQQQGSQVSGTGHYSLEAGRAGALSVSGTDEGSVVTLTFQYDYGLVTTFTGTLADANHLSGTVAPAGGGPSFPLTLVRQ
jgi:hypothetical protein